MANAQEKELAEKITALVEERFGGDYRTAFDHYARSNGGLGLMDRTELVELLTDAGVGNTFTRGMWADGVIAKLDTNRDGLIAFTELQAFL